VPTVPSRRSSPDGRRSRSRCSRSLLMRMPNAVRSFLARVEAVRARGHDRNRTSASASRIGVEHMPMWSDAGGDVASILDVIEERLRRISVPRSESPASKRCQRVQGWADTS